MITLLLHNIRSVHNVGSIFRTADAAGVSKIILSGYSPTPLDRFGRERKDFTKVSLGAEKSVPWEYKPILTPTLKKLKKEGFEIVAIEQHKQSKNLFNYVPQNKNIAVVMGNEVRGVSPAVLKACDTILEIPMQGKKESLNVSVAAGVALFTLTRTLE
jgi:23S rRNA (guanosine2251-2'-O)-methyltransferase